jgi:NADPH-dependent ferric siderophore reductase
MAAAKPRATWAEWDIKIRELDVLRREQVTPRMVRLTLGGPNMAGFESHIADEHCKLVFPDPDTGTTRPPVQDGDHLDWPRPFPIARDYTIRRYDEVAGEIDLDFVVHAGGVASEWARTCAIGSTIWLAGPRPSRIVPPEFGFLVLLGDETALPAISRWLEEMPADARGVVAVEVDGPEEEQKLSVPTGVELTWLHRNGAARGATTLLGDFARGITIPEGVHSYVWAGGEAISLKPVRAWARSTGHGKDQSDITGYWRRGVTQDELEKPTLRDRVEHAVAHLLGREH